MLQHFSQTALPLVCNVRLYAPVSLKLRERINFVDRPHLPSVTAQHLVSRLARRHGHNLLFFPIGDGLVACFLVFSLLSFLHNFTTSYPKPACRLSRKSQTADDFHLSFTALLSAWSLQAQLFLEPLVVLQLFFFAAFRRSYPSFLKHARSHPSRLSRTSLEDPASGSLSSIHTSVPAGS